MPLPVYEQHMQIKDLQAFLSQYGKVTQEYITRYDLFVFRFDDKDFNNYDVAWGSTPFIAIHNLMGKLLASGIEFKGV